MVLREAGEVGCAHCTTTGANATCSICTLIVCATCADDWGSCTEPTGREVRLGLTARVRDIDPSGRYALVSHWRAPLRLFDLRRLRWVDGVAFPRELYNWARLYPPRLTSDGRMVHAALEDGTARYQGFWSRALAGPDRVWLEGTPFAFPHDTGISSVGDWFHYLTGAPQVIVVEPGVQAMPYDPLGPFKTVTAMSIDGARRLLAAGAAGEIALGRIADSRYTPLAQTWTAKTGRVAWVGVAGPWMCVLLSSGVPADLYLEVRRLESSLAIGPAVMRSRIGLHYNFRGASMSVDGRFIAIAINATIVLVTLDTGDTTLLDGHTDEINAIRFASDDHRLISADTDNRIIIRPRTDAGTTLRHLEVR